MTQSTTPEPRIGRDWRIILVVALAIYAVALCLRLLDYQGWNHDFFRVDGEFILGTHDAYHWVAGAEGSGFAVGQPPAVLAGFLADLFGTSAARVGYWLPVFVASLVAVATLLWAWTLGGVEAGICAGLVAALAPGFLNRTRLGYYDTDMVTLLFPLLTGWAVAFWLKPYLGRGWPLLRRLFGRAKAEEAGSGPPRISREWRGLLWMLGAGLAARYFGTWHGYIDIYSKLVLCVALVLGLLTARPGHRPLILWGLSLFGLAAFVGWTGLGIGFGLGVALVLLPRLWPKGEQLAMGSVWPALIVLAGVFVASGLVGTIWDRVLFFVHGYIKPVAQGAGDAANGTGGPAVVYPGIGQSVIEAQNIDISAMFSRFHPWPWVTFLGFLGLVAMLFVNPLFVFIAPLAVLGVLAPWFGARMSMFGGPAAGLGLAVPLALMCRRSLVPASSLLRQCVGWIPPLLLLGILALKVSAMESPYRAIPLTLLLALAGCWVLRRVLRNVAWRKLVTLGLAVELLVFLQLVVGFGLTARLGTNPWLGLGVLLPLVWLAGELLANRDNIGLASLGFQGALAVALIFPLWTMYEGRFPTPVLDRSHCLALKDMRQYAPEDSRVWTWWDWGYATHYYARRISFADGARHSGEYVFTLGLVMTTDSPRQAAQLIKYSALHDYEPWKVWNTMTPRQVKDFLASLERDDLDLKAPQKQYLVVTFENFRLAPWINFYGSWNVLANNGLKSRVIPFYEAEVDPDKGKVILEHNGEWFEAELDTLDIMASNPGNKGTWDYHRKDAWHLVWLPEMQSYYLMNPLAYDSMLVQLMLAEPEDKRFSPFFKLMYEDYPFVRIYEVL